ncbi:2Fe-2S iron-sulfur cluster-binding protein [Paenibacillus sp. KS-LC4]|uniref:2Fe-2S iron-sulfur cluster-binding protein n=1 Tax=Paenibacillus sp. KS-LC4 TaxID=2979727 RepID=UPI0030D4C248
MIELTGRTRTAIVEAEDGLSLLDLAMKHNVDFAFSCTRGTCARCRCQVIEGASGLEGITDQEWDRMDPEEFEEGYRLACQAIVKSVDVNIKAINKTYF